MYYYRKVKEVTDMNIIVGIAAIALMMNPVDTCVLTSGHHTTYTIYSSDHKTVYEERTNFFGDVVYEDSYVVYYDSVEGT